ncbi:MAG TPA: hypothetical protein VER39_13260 [Nocardioidaceae bacterium]|nr:hypothetical protein [Nocardioidaceae bacterium]
MSSVGWAAPVPPGAPNLAGPALLERAIGYTRASLQLVAQADLRGRTPCRDWDLLSLLHHMDDSLAAFTDAAEIGYVDLLPLPGTVGPEGAASPADRLGAPTAPTTAPIGRTATPAEPTSAPTDATATPADDVARMLIERLKQRACAALGAWASPPVGAIAVADRELRSDLLAAAGALEIAVHGWDVARACGVDRPLPPALAVELLDVVPALVGPEDRPQRFAEAIAVPLHARPSTRLLAAVGRRAV